MCFVGVRKQWYDVDDGYVRTHEYGFERRKDVLEMVLCIACTASIALVYG